VGARAYDPRTARWLQRDPIDAASGDPNLYRYCGNEPINLLDPDGQSWVDFIPLIGSGRDLQEGIREGNWNKIALGAGGLLLDLTTVGTGTIVKGFVKGGVKSALRQEAKQGAANGLQRVAQQGAKTTTVSASKGAAKSAQPQDAQRHIMTNKNKVRGKAWTKQFEQLLDKCNAKHLLDAPDNLVGPPFEEHRKRAPHSEGYHSWVYLQRDAEGKRWN